MTLVEVMVAMAMISITCTSFMFVFSQLNQMAMVSRLSTGAAALAQSQIDLISTDAPFQPQYGITPSELTPGTVSTSVNVYDDPISGNTVAGTMTTIITAVDATYPNGTVTDTLYLYTANVTVTYTYRNRSYSVSYSTLRTSDV
jgi:type II secretory pathway pseudopilin PulG